MKIDAKIDMLHQSGLFGKTPGKSRRVLEDLEDEEDVEMSIVRPSHSYLDIGSRVDKINLR